MSKRGRAAWIVAGWGLYNVWLAAIIVPFGPPTEFERLGIYLSSEIFTMATAIAVWRLRKRPGVQPGRITRSGGPALALALAVMFAAWAWVLGVYIAYFAVPLLAYAVGKWRSERIAAREIQEVK